MECLLLRIGPKTVLKLTMTTSLGGMEFEWTLSHRIKCVNGTDAIQSTPLGDICYTPKMYSESEWSGWFGVYPYCGYVMGLRENSNSGVFIWTGIYSRSGMAAAAQV